MHLISVLSKLRHADLLGWLAIYPSPLGKFQAQFQASKKSCLKNEEGGEKKDEEEKDEKKKEEEWKRPEKWHLLLICGFSLNEYACIHTGIHTQGHTHEYIYTINKNSQSKNNCTAFDFLILVNKLFTDLLCINKDWWTHNHDAFLRLHVNVCVILILFFLDSRKLVSSFCKLGRHI